MSVFFSPFYLEKPGKNWILEHGKCTFETWKKLELGVGWHVVTCKRIIFPTENHYRLFLTSCNIKNGASKVEN